MEHDVSRAGKDGPHSGVVLSPCFEASFQFGCSLLHFGAHEPPFYRALVESNEEAFTSVLDGRNPSRIVNERSAFDADVEFTGDVGTSVIKAGEAHQRGDL